MESKGKLMTLFHKICWSIVALIFVVIGAVAISQKLSLVRAEEQDSASKRIIANQTQNQIDPDKLQAEHNAQRDKDIANIQTGAQARAVLQPIYVPSGVPAPSAQVKVADLPAATQAQLPPGT